MTLPERLVIERLEREFFGPVQELGSGATAVHVHDEIVLCVRPSEEALQHICLEGLPFPGVEREYRK